MGAHDDAVHAVQRRVDATPTAYLRRLLREVGHDAAPASELASTVYLLLIGAGHVVPPLRSSELRRLWTRALAGPPAVARR